MDNIKVFNPKELKDNFFMYVVGMRRSGKTTIIKDILFNSKKKFDEVYLISETADLSGDYDDYVKNFHIFELERAEEVLAKVDAEQRTIQNKDLRRKILFILDDVITEGNRATWDNLATYGRHLKSSVILLSQSMKAISPKTRKNADYALMSASRNYDDIEAFVREYLTGSFSGGNTTSTETLRNSMNIYNEITKEPYFFIFVDSSAQTRNINDFVYKYKASGDIKKFNIYSGYDQKLQNGRKNSKLYKDIKNKILNNNIKKNGNKRLKSSAITQSEPRAIIPESIITTNLLFSKRKPRYDHI